MTIMTQQHELPVLYAIRYDGEVVYGRAKSVEYERDIEPMTWGRQRVSVTTASRMVIDFEECGETLVDFYATDMRAIDRELERRAVEARERRLRARLLANRVTVDRLVGRRITRIQGDSEVLAFHLSDESVWAFWAAGGSWGQYSRPDVAVGGKVTRVDTDGCLRLFVDEHGSSPAVFRQESDYGDGYFFVSTAFEPTRAWLESAPVIA